MKPARMFLVFWLESTPTPRSTMTAACSFRLWPAAAVPRMKRPSRGPEMSDPTSELTAQLIEQGGRNLISGVSGFLDVVPE